MLSFSMLRDWNSATQLWVSLGITKASKRSRPRSREREREREIERYIYRENMKHGTNTHALPSTHAHFIPNRHEVKITTSLPLSSLHN